MPSLIQQGSRNAHIVIVGEAPGEVEQRSGVPFSGGSGQLLDRMLSRAGIRRADCFVTNLCHVRPPGNDFNWFLRTAEGQQALTWGMLQLRKDLLDIHPNLVIALGAQPLKAITGVVGIEKWRGSLLPSKLVPGLKVIGTYHPAYIMRVWDYKAVADFDLARCSKEASSPELTLPHRDLILDPPLGDLPRLTEELSQARWLAVDIECFEASPGKWSLACVGFSDRASRAVTIPARLETMPYIRALCSCDAPKVLQNGTFDVTVLKMEGIELRKFEWDTMLGHHSIFPECASSPDEMSALSGRKRSAAIQKGLAFQASIYTKEPFYKDDGKLWKQDGDLKKFWEYNAKDAAVTREIRDVQDVEIEAFGTRSVFALEMSLVPVFMEMTEYGILVDQDKHKEFMAKYLREIDNLQRFLDGAAGGSVNVKSPKQVMDLLYNQLKLPVKYVKRKTAGGEIATPSANKDSIVELAGKYKHPVLMSILEIRKRRDIIERYLNAALDVDGVMRCAFDITGTRTGRPASRQSIFGTGMNLFNIPAEIREMFIARPGHVLINVDYKQAEAVVVAYLARCQQLIELFSDPTRDVHTENAMRIFGKPREQINKSVERYLAKKIVHASNYGMAAKRFSEVVNEDAETTKVRITPHEAQQLINKYFMLFPEIKENFWAEVQRELQHSRILTTLLGRKRQFFGRYDDKLLREAYAFIPQGTVGDLGNMALVRVHKELKGIARPLLTVYDSILVEVEESKVLEAAVAVQECMRIPVSTPWHTFTIGTDVKIGRNWGEHSDENPNGLREDWS